MPHFHHHHHLHPVVVLVVVVLWQHRRPPYVSWWSVPGTRNASIAPSTDCTTPRRCDRRPPPRGVQPPGGTSRKWPNRAKNQSPAKQTNPNLILINPPAYKVQKFSEVPDQSGWPFCLLFLEIPYFGLFNGKFQFGNWKNVL